MTKTPYPDDWEDINTTLYNRSIKLFSAVKNILSVKIALYAEPRALQGDIFLFNHFSRFETFIPQFLIHEKTGAYSCAIASGEFFEEDNLLSSYLKKVGVFPHDHGRLFPLLAAQILRGRKIIIFPEGGMVKDHRVIDKLGNYSVFSRTTGQRRKQHTGSAVLGQGVETFKAAIRYAHQSNNSDQLSRWKDELLIDSIGQLLAVAMKPTIIIPANITFYPIRTSENLLFKAAELFSANLSLRETEELLIEGNIMLKNTDMDIRMGTPVNPSCIRDLRTRSLMDQVAPDIHSLDDVFNLNSAAKNSKQRLLGSYFFKNSECARDHYMQIIYANVTINLSHLASTLIMYLIERKQTTITKLKFYEVLYIAIKILQTSIDVHLHPSLVNPDDYSDLHKDGNKRFDYFIGVAKEKGLISDEAGAYHFLPKLCAEFSFDSIRLENPIAVYYNEAAPIHAIRETLITANTEYSKSNSYKFAAWHFDDECRALAWEKNHYAQPQYSDINRQEVIIADPSPFFIQPEQANGFGMLLVHGLLASPAELRGYGDYLAKQGYTVLGVRLKGHGTSPYALREQNWENWYGCVQRGFEILKAYCQKIFIAGFSTGGALALKLAAEQHPEIVGIIAVSVPIKFVNPVLMLVPLLQAANTLIEWVSTFEGVKPFVENPTEHPDVNYHHVPVRALYELRQLIAQLDSILPKVNQPVLVVYADNDPVVAASSAQMLFDRLGSNNKKLCPIPSDRHGILMENMDGTWGLIDGFLKEIAHSGEATSLKNMAL
jgi:esterase/lipase